MKFSDFIVYVDESGDHGLISIDENYPVFVLVYCIFKKKEYSDQTVKDLINFKFKYFGHDQIILHERDIRKSRGEFNILLNEEIRNEFMNDIGFIVERIKFKIIAVVIKKNDLKKKYTYPVNPYHIAVMMGLERVFKELCQVGCKEGITHFIFESRGKKEDQQLELEFLRSLSGNLTGENLPFKIIFAQKASNCSGLQLADLIARPIGRHIINPDAENRAYEVIKRKFVERNGQILNYGLKVFP